MKWLQLKSAILLLIWSFLLTDLPSVASESKPNEDEEFKTARNKDYSYGQFYLTNGEWEKARTCFENICRTCQNQDSIIWFADASMKLACLDEQEGNLQEGKIKCDLALHFLKKISDLDSNSDKFSGWECTILWKLADLEFYLNHRNSALKAIDQAIEMSQTEYLRRKRPTLYMELLHRKGLMLERLNRAKSDKLFKESYSLQLKQMESILGCPLVQINAQNESGTSVPIFRLKTETLSDSQLRSIEYVIDEIPDLYRKALARRGYYVIFLSPYKAPGAKLNTYKDGDFVFGAFSSPLKAIYIYNDEDFKLAASNSYSKSETVFHEFGHAMDDYLGDFSQTIDFYNALLKDCDVITDYFSTPAFRGRISPKKRREKFAHIFSHLHFGNVGLSTPRQKKTLEFDVNITKVVRQRVENLKKPMVKRFPNYFLYAQ